MATTLVASNAGAIPGSLRHPGAARFWLAVCLIGMSTGCGAAALTLLLEAVQHTAWRGSPSNILEAATHASVPRHVVVLIAAGILVSALSAWRHVRIVRQMDANQTPDLSSSASVIAIATFLALIGIAMAAYLLAVRWPGEP